MSCPILPMLTFGLPVSEGAKSRDADTDLARSTATAPGFRHCPPGNTKLSGSSPTACATPLLPSSRSGGGDAAPSIAEIMLILEPAPGVYRLHVWAVPHPNADDVPELVRSRRSSLDCDGVAIGCSLSSVYPAVSKAREGELTSLPRDARWAGLALAKSGKTGFGLGFLRHQPKGAR